MRTPRRALVGTLALALGLLAAGASRAQTEPSVIAAPATIYMAPGEIVTMPVNEIQRAAVGDPAIVDVTVISSNELMLQAKKAGASTLLFWDRGGQHMARVEVALKRPEAIAAKLQRVITEMRFPDVRVVREDETVMLVGEVPTVEDEARLQVALVPFKDQVVNLIRTTPTPVPREVAGPLVALSVQVVELNRSDLEQLGVKWSESFGLSEAAVTDATIKESFLRWGTNAGRTELSATLNALVQKKRARLLAEPKLVTASGKEASSFIGVEVPVINATSVGTGGGSVSASVDFRQTGVLLKMTPTVLADEQIKTVVEAEVSSVDTSVGLNIPVGSDTVLVPGFSVRKTSTELTTASGETILIAGLLQAEDTNNIDQVPALGSIPVLGRLFRSPTVKTTERELVIAVTPELLAQKGSDTDRTLALEQALASAEVVASVEDPRLRYALAVQDRIARALRYPSREKETGMAGTVKLRLHLFSDGTLGQVVVTQSSGVEALDMEARKIAESQAPYSTFPSELRERELWLQIPVVFRP